MTVAAVLRVGGGGVLRLLLLVLSILLVSPSEGCSLDGFLYLLAGAIVGLGCEVVQCQVVGILHPFATY